VGGGCLIPLVEPEAWRGAARRRNSSTDKRDKPETAMGYNPNQPRAPKGTEDGGQWVDHDGSADRPPEITDQMRRHYALGQKIRAAAGVMVGVKEVDAKAYVAEEKRQSRRYRGSI